MDNLWIWLVVEAYPSEKYGKLSKVSWYYYSQCMEKVKCMFQTTNQHSDVCLQYDCHSTKSCDLGACDSTSARPLIPLTNGPGSSYSVHRLHQSRILHAWNVYTVYLQWVMPEECRPIHHTWIYMDYLGCVVVLPTSRIWFFPTSMIWFFPISMIWFLTKRIPVYPNNLWSWILNHPASYMNIEAVLKQRKQLAHILL